MKKQMHQLILALGIQAVAVMTAMTFKTSCMADIVVSIDRKTAEAGQTVFLGVFASSETGDVISGFNLPFDYNIDGYIDAQQDGIGDLPTGFSLAPTPLSSLVYFNTGLDSPVPQVQLIGADAIVTGTGGDIVLGNSLNPTKLFDLVVVIDPSVAVGTILPFSIKVPNDPFQDLFNVAGPNAPEVAIPKPDTPATGFITIVAVPEPSSLGLLLAASFVSCGVWRWRRKADSNRSRPNENSEKF